MAIYAGQCPPIRRLWLASSFFSRSLSAFLSSRAYAFAQRVEFQHSAVVLQDYPD